MINNEFAHIFENLWNRCNAKKSSNLHNFLNQQEKNDLTEIKCGQNLKNEIFVRGIIIVGLNKGKNGRVLLLIHRNGDNSNFTFIHLALLDIKVRSIK